MYNRYYIGGDHGDQKGDAETSAALEECKEVHVTTIQGVEKWEEATEVSRTQGERISVVVL